jgi:thiamine-phosphate pyrophosphorylase
MADTDTAQRLYLMLPPLSEAGDWPQKLQAALGAGDVACVLAPLSARDEGTAKKIVKDLVGITEAAGVALLIDAPSLVMRAGADGAHLRVTPDTLEKTVPDAVKLLKKEERILGIGGLRAKHDAMIAGEYDVDYVSFGDPAPDGYVPPIDQIAERASWWAEIFNVPCVAHAPTIADVATLAKAGADFISLREAVWDDARGPATAVAEAQNLLAANANARERE